MSKEVESGYALRFRCMPCDVAYDVDARDLEGYKPPCPQCHTSMRVEILDVLPPLTEKPIDMIIFCPTCRFQHVDAPDLTSCMDCGHPESDHEHEEDGVVDPHGWCRQHMKEKCAADCHGFKPWTNPPHKKHRCLQCNHVFKVANVPTNGVAELPEVSR